MTSTSDHLPFGTSSHGADTLGLGAINSRAGAAFPKLKVISLFAGIGGIDLGLERTGGFETVATAETDPYASKVLHLRFPGVINLGDVTQAEYPDADLICAGFPCQDISYAGAGAGLAGARSGLFWEVVRAVSVVRPRFVLLENVAALLSRGLDTVLWALAEIGYDAEWHCIPASAVGAPHRRDRIWIVAHARSEQYQGSSHPLSGALAAELLEALANSQGNGQPIGGAGHEGRNSASESEVGLWPEFGRDGAGSRTQPVANASFFNVEGLEPSITDAEEWERSLERSTGPCSDGLGWWAAEPNVGRVAHGVPKRVDRLRSLGNAVVPQIPELIGRAILTTVHEESSHEHQAAE